MKYFAAVAEELHFTRAAERLGIAQPPSSRAIAQLERRLGAQLLRRTSRRVDLTEAGRSFLTQSRIALAAIDEAVRQARKEATSRLTLALRAGSGTALMPDLAKATPSGVELAFTYDARAMLRDGTADAALLCGYR